MNMFLRRLTAVLLYVFCVRESEQGCVPPKQIQGGYFEPYRNSYKYGDKIQYSCETGYHRTAGALTRTCQGIVQINAWTWSGTEPACSSVDCGHPAIPRATYASPAGTTYSSTMAYRCKEGFAPMGNLLAECTANATWRFTPCKEPEFHCPKPPEVGHATPNASLVRQQHGTTIRYRCDAGYSLEGADEILLCQKTTWSGTLPKCVISAVPGTSGKPTNKPPGLSENALPIVAGVVTAILLTAILIVTILCLRRRHRKSQQRHPEAMLSVAPVAASTPQNLHYMQSNCSHRAYPTASEGGANDSTLPHHRIQCPHTHAAPNIMDYTKSEQNYVPDSSLSHFRPLVGNYEHAHSSSPSTVQSEVSVTDSEFHTIRECLGDFKNNNLPSSEPHSQSLHILHRPHPHAFTSEGTTPRTRTLWTADGRPYEAVTCAHGVEHIYQPLEHIYEEPHIWTRPLPDCQH